MNRPIATTTAPQIRMNRPIATTTAPQIRTKTGLPLARVNGHLKVRGFGQLKVRTLRSSLLAITSW
jgi:hypothetical protein